MSESLIHFLFTVNADFSDDAQVERILDTWEEFRPDANNSSHHHKRGFDVDDEGQTGVIEKKHAPISKEIPIMFRRHLLLIVRDRTSKMYFRLPIRSHEPLVSHVPFLSTCQLFCTWVAP